MPGRRGSISASGSAVRRENDWSRSGPNISSANSCNPPAVTSRRRERRRTVSKASLSRIPGRRARTCGRDEIARCSGRYDWNIVSRNGPVGAGIARASLTASSKSMFGRCRRLYSFEFGHAWDFEFHPARSYTDDVVVLVEIHLRIATLHGDNPLIHALLAAAVIDGVDGDRGAVDRALEERPGFDLDDALTASSSEVGLTGYAVE